MADDRFAQLYEICAWFTEWEEQSKLLPGTANERKKATLSDKTLFDLKSMVFGFKHLCKATFDKHPGSVIYPWRINTNLVGP